MIKKIIVALSALAAAGCFFGGDSDSSTSLTGDPKVDGSDLKSITPGLYAANYDWIDSSWQGLESEFILNSSGSFQHFYVFMNDAKYEQRGKWTQKDSAFLFAGMEETQGDGGFFDEYQKVDPDTNKIMKVTDTSFMRLEWTPLRQKPYWITYFKKTYPKLKDGAYHLTKVDTSSSPPVSILTTITLKGDTYDYSYAEDDVESYQINARYRQVGSFLAIDEIRYRQVDSTLTFPEWSTTTGTALSRIQTVEEESFDLWNPGDFFSAAGWEPYATSAD